MTGAAPSDDHVRKASVRSRIATARTKAEELEHRSVERLNVESGRRGWVRTQVNA